MKTGNKIVFYISSFLLLLLVAGVGGGAFVYFKFAKDLPDVAILKKYKPSLVTRVYDVKDRLVAEFYIEKRILTPLSKIPQEMILSTIAIEDASFYEHHGINLEGIIRATIANIEAGHVVQGGSSITQQVAKQVLLTSERTFTRKIKEALLSIKLDQTFTKNEILEIYLNHIYYGHGAYGVTAAAEVYFGKELADLTLAEMAMISGLPKAPNNYSPYRHPEKAKNRRHHALERLVDIGAITKTQQEEADAEPFKLSGLKKPINNAPWYAEHIRRILEKKYGAKTLYREGLTVRTPLDLGYQRYANMAIKEGLEINDRRIGYRGPLRHIDIENGEEPDFNLLKEESAKEKNGIVLGMVQEVKKEEVVVLLPEQTGIIPLKKMDWAHPVNKRRDARWIGKIKDARKVLKPGDVIEVKIGSSYVKDGALPLSLWQEPAGQGALMLMEARTGFVRAMIGGYDHNKSKFNRAVQAKRQPGSSFKPLIYASAIDKGFTPATIVIDSPIIYNKALGQFKGWKPTNFEEKFFGPTTVREAMTHSRNVVTIKILDKIGVGYAADFATRRFGIRSKLDRNLSLALGASPVSMLEMVTAYSTLANGGKRPSPIFITSIEDRKGNLLFHAEPQLKEVISPSTAYLTTNIMTGVVKRGTAVKVDRALKRPVAGKTGTTNNYIDAWFSGFTPDLVCSVWVGNDDNTSMGKRETGSRAAIPTWIAFMKNVLADRPIKDFDAPSDIIFVKIDRKSGKLARMGVEGDKFFESFLDGTEPTEYEATGRIDTEEQNDSVGF